MTKMRDMPRTSSARKDSASSLDDLSSRGPSPSGTTLKVSSDLRPGGPEVTPVRHENVSPGEHGLVRHRKSSHWELCGDNQAISLGSLGAGTHRSEGSAISHGPAVGIPSLQGGEDVKTYMDLALRSAPHLGTPTLDFAHAALGLVDEAYELALATSEQNTLEELGDLLWFIALAGHALEADPFSFEAGFHDVERASGTIGTMVAWLGEHAARVAGAAKTWLVDGQAPTAEITCRLARMVDLVRTIGERHGWTLEHIQEANIAKLTVTASLEG